MRLLVYLLMEEEDCIYAAFRVDLPAAYIVLKLEAHRSIRGAQAVSVERMPLKGILRHMHPINLSHRIAHFLNCILQEHAPNQHHICHSLQQFPVPHHHIEAA